MFNKNRHTLGVPKVCFHGFMEDDYNESGSWGKSNIDKETDVTDFVTNLSFTHSVNAPWESIQLTVEIPQSQVHTVIPGVTVFGSDRGVGTGRAGGEGTGLGFGGSREDNLDKRRFFRQPVPGFWVVLYLPNMTHGKKKDRKQKAK